MTTHKTAYGRITRLTQDLNDVESWNLSGDTRFTLQKGTKVKIIHVYDTFHTIIVLLDENGKSTHHPDNKSAYRFIVNNIALSDVTGIYIPTRTRDVVGEIIQAEYSEGYDNELETWFFDGYDKD